MLACITTAAVLGLEGRLVEVQMDIAHQGLPNFFLVGLPSTAVKEARERVRTAIKNSGLRVSAAADHRQPGARRATQARPVVRPAAGAGHPGRFGPGRPAGPRARGDFILPCARPTDLGNGQVAEGVLDLAEVRGQEHAKRALEIAAAGGHNALMTGLPRRGHPVPTPRPSTVWDDEMATLWCHQATKLPLVQTGGELAGVELVRHGEACPGRST